MGQSVSIFSQNPSMSPPSMSSADTEVAGRARGPPIFPRLPLGVGPFCAWCDADVAIARSLSATLLLSNQAELGDGLTSHIF